MNVRWREATWYSKLISYALLVGIFLVGLYIGDRYGSATSYINTAQYSVPLHGPIISLGAPRSPVSTEEAAEVRDSIRVSDLATLKSLVSLYIAENNNPILCSKKGKIYSSNEGTNAIDGTGWVPINLTQIASGSLDVVLPRDPVNTGELVYSYACDPQNDTFEFTARMESEKYGKGGSGDVVSTDYGSNPNVYEVGTDLTIIPNN